MGQVYRATVTKLKRQVAQKILPEVSRRHAAASTQRVQTENVAVADLVLEEADDDLAE